MFKKIKYWFRVKLGLCRCSGYGIYPNGINVPDVVTVLLKN